ncbi:MAG: YggT family protein [Gammaproteobacteria bacterium]|nr:YggT family protein [Gammaproteobacteria bacterium]MCB1925184.1 YggT family protein [Gammaproteobacteria bacterium]
MGEGYLATPAVFLVQVIFGLYATLVVLRFLLQLTRADFYNPVSQLIVKATKPLLNPLRRIIPGTGGMDIASLVLAWLVLTIEQLLILGIAGAGFQPVAAMLLAIPELITLIINIFIFAILIQVVISWISPGTYNPALSLISTLTEPLLGPVRRRMPDLGGFDLSPMVVIVGLVVLQMLLIPPIKGLISHLV